VVARTFRLYKDKAAMKLMEKLARELHAAAKLVKMEEPEAALEETCV
jgi:hypothetical protein